MFLLLFTLLGCPSRSVIGMGRSLTTTDHRMLGSSPPYPSQAVQLQMVIHSSLTFTLLSLKEACSCKPIATCDLVTFFFQETEVQQEQRKRLLLSSPAFVVWTKLGVYFDLCLKRLCL